MLVFLAIMSNYAEKRRQEGHDESCNERSELPDWRGCTCGKRRHDAELASARNEQSRLAARLTRTQRERDALRDACSRIYRAHDATIEELREIAYEAIRATESAS